MTLFDHTRGIVDAPIVFVGESWGSEEAAQGVPFVGGSGKELDRLIVEAGLDPTQILFTNVFNAQPQGNDAFRFFLPKAKGNMVFQGLHPTPFVMDETSRLTAQIRAYPRKLVIAAGNYALWAPSDRCSISSVSDNGNGIYLVPSGIMNWRGSMLSTMGVSQILPLIHPAAILRQWALREVTLHDLRIRVPLALKGDWSLNPGPTILCDLPFVALMEHLTSLLVHLEKTPIPLLLAHDTETRAGEIVCHSIATGPYDSLATAIVIPLVAPSDRPGYSLNPYWTLEQEIDILQLLYRILTHQNVRVIGQNYLYDIQYLLLHGIEPTLDFDTMLAHHLLFPGTPKGLDYLSSLYCKYHVYWKEDLKEWDTHTDFQRNLQYSGTDALRTYECATVLRNLIDVAKQNDQWLWEKKKMGLALRMMKRGILIDRQERARLAFELADALQQRHSWLSSIVPQSFVAHLVKNSKKQWWHSVAQQKHLFYEVLGLMGQTNRKTGKPTIDFEALQELKRKNPEYTRIFDTLAECRSISVYHNTFIQAGLDHGDRMRCSFNIAGTKTFRWSSSENAFGRGTNLQNIPIGESDE